MKGFNPGEYLDYPLWGFSVLLLIIAVKNCIEHRALLPNIILLFSLCLSSCMAACAASVDRNFHDNIPAVLTMFLIAYIYIYDWLTTNDNLSMILGSLGCMLFLRSFLKWSGYVMI